MKEKIDMCKLTLFDRLVASMHVHLTVPLSMMSTVLVFDSGHRLMVAIQTSVHHFVVPMMDTIFDPNLTLVLAMVTSS